MGNIYKKALEAKQQKNKKPQEQQKSKVFYSTDKGVTGDKPQNIKDEQRGKIFGNPGGILGN